MNNYHVNYFIHVKNIHCRTMQGYVITFISLILLYFQFLCIIFTCDCIFLFCTSFYHVYTMYISQYFSSPPSLLVLFWISLKFCSYVCVCADKSAGACEAREIRSGQSHCMSFIVLCARPNSHVQLFYHLELLVCGDVRL